MKFLTDLFNNLRFSAKVWGGFGAVLLLTMVSDAVAAALDANPSLSLTLQDWRSGTTKRVMLEVSLLGATA